MLMLILLMHMLMIFLVKTVTTPFDCMISIWMHAHKIVTGVQYHSEHAHDLYLNACSPSTRNLHLEHAQDLYLLGQLNPKELCHTHD